MQDETIEYPGSRWLKFDFHTHTPASDDYGRGDETEKSITPEEWIQAAMTAGLDCVVVADHNTGDWIDRLKQKNQEIRDWEEKPDWYRDLTLFPGVEMTVSGSSSRIHLLGVFDPSKDSRKITAVLGACGITDGFGDPEGTSTARGFVDTVGEIINAGGIAIPAHIDGAKGLLENKTSLTRETENSLKSIAGAEFCDAHKFDQADAGLRKVVNNLAKLAGSDAHTLEEIARFSTWIKMSRPSIEGLELALMDHEFCVKNQIDDPNGVPDIFLSKLEISSMAHCGRVEPMSLSLHPHFNAVIGGRGTGKSTLLESIRLAARRENELEPFEKLRDELRRFSQGNTGPRKNRGVMLEDTQILLGIHRRGKDFQLRWRNDGTGDVLEEQDQGVWQAVETGNLNERFPLSIYSQKQINELASNPRGLLEIVDRAPQVDRSEWDGRWEDQKSGFLQIREQQRTMKRQLSEEPQIRAKLKDVESDLKQYEDKGHGDILKLYQKRSQQKSSLPSDQIFDTLSAGLKDLAETAGLSDFQDHLFDEGDGTADELRAIHDQTAHGLETIRTSLQALATSVDALKQDKNKQTEKSQWYQSLQSSIEAYTNLVKEYEEKESKLSISLYGDWVQERNRLQGQLKQLDGMRRETDRLKSLLGDSFKALQDLRKELIEKRRAFIDQVIGSSAYVRMEMVQFGDVSGVEEEYRELLNIEGTAFRSSICDLASDQGILRDFCVWEEQEKEESEIADLVYSIKKETFDIANGKTTGNHGAFDNRLKNLMEKQPAAFDRLWTFWPEDHLRVKYSKDPASGRFADLEKGSAGQKAAAILAFLLSHGDEPLVIDQPEDDLDNALIYDLIVAQIHENKSRRQLVIVTHNPNIVVNGDAELVHVLKFKNGQVQLDAQDGIVEAGIRGAICTIMEGGRQAFDKRYKRITMGDSHV